MAFCIDITQLVNDVYPGSLDNLGQTRAAQTLISDLADVAYQYISLYGGDRQRLKNMIELTLNWGFSRSPALRRARHHAVPGMPRNPTPPEVGILLSDLSHMIGRADRQSFIGIINDMSAQRTKLIGGMGVLNFLRQRGFRNIHSLEMSVRESGVHRIYDIVLNGAQLHQLEIKNWSRIDHLPFGRWSGSCSQLLRDFILSRSRNITWIFFTETRSTPGVLLQTVSADMQNTIYRLLSGAGRRRTPYTLNDILTRLRAVNDLNTLAENISEDFVHLFTRPDGSFSANKKARLISALRDHFEHISERVFINPG